jgi:hypothetical protein
MTRILYWNVQKFGLNKINNPSLALEPGTGISQNAASLQRRNYMNTHFTMTDPVTGAVSPPDIFVVVEVVTPNTGVGLLGRGAGTKGSRQLLTAIRNNTGNANWMLVPPLQVGRREAVAIFYDSTNYAFTGPWQWPGGNGPAFDPNAAFAPANANYPARYNARLPNRNIPGGAPNAGISERRVAAATGFTLAAGLVGAGNAINYYGLRPPYLATFAELNGMGALVRNISLFAIHAPATRQLARIYVRLLGYTAEIVDGIGADEARIVVGDFNVNLMHNDLNRTRTAAYNQLLNFAPNYTLGIDRPGAPPAPLDGYLGYFATHMKTVGGSSYWSTLARPEYYPGYGYVGSQNANNFYSIDNILAAYGGVAAGGPMANVTVPNGVVGSNYGGMLAPGNAPVGHYVLPVQMADLAQFAATPPVAPAAALTLPARRTAFINWINFRRIRSTSDHMAILADV